MKDPVIYSNFDNVLDKEVETSAFLEGIRVQHAAWNYCGWIICRAGVWTEEVMQYGAVVRTFTGASAQEVIDATITEFGGE